MTALDRVLDTLPHPYTIEPDSTLSGFLGFICAELDVLNEDIDLLRRTHWVDHAFRLGDLEKLAALVGVTKLSWEDLRTFRSRVLAVVDARLHGAIDPGSIRRFVFDYLTLAEDALHTTLVPGLAGSADADAAFRERSDRPLYRPLRLVENPPVTRRSGSLLARRGRIPYLFRWEETNNGLADSVARFSLTGFPEGRTAQPVLVNLTSGDLVGWTGVLALGQRLELTAAPADGGGGDDDLRALVATVDGADVTDAAFSISGVRHGVPFEPDDFDPVPLLPRMVRGTNHWLYLSVGRFDKKGLDRVFFAIAGRLLQEGVFDQSRFDHALFPVGPLTKLTMEWLEREPASFEVQVPRYLTVESPEAAAQDDFYDELAEAIQVSLDDLHAVGVQATARFVPFEEAQPQHDRARLPWKVIPPEPGPTGEITDVDRGAEFGRSGLDQSRFS